MTEKSTGRKAMRKVKSKVELVEEELDQVRGGTLRVNERQTDPSFATQADEQLIEDAVGKFREPTKH
jgi:hypothetical protein